jgi:hypothetical protein
MEIEPSGKRKSYSLVRGSLFFLVFALGAYPAAAHQPVVSFGAEHPFLNPVVIGNPEVSKAYFGILRGKPDYYRIDSRTTFQLYLNILVPDRKDSALDMTVDVVSDNKPLLRLRGKGYAWERFFEPFARDHYLKGPELDWRLRRGTYFIKVYNGRNAGKYSLAVGTAESFSLPAIVGTAFTLPVIKERFFNKPAYTAFFSPLGLIFLGYVIIAAGIAVGVFFITRRYVRQ